MERGRRGGGDGQIRRTEDKEGTFGEEGEVGVGVRGWKDLRWGQFGEFY